jgi:transcriptional regulator with XRE-family HTH domain
MLSENLKKARKAAGMTQVEVAKHLAYQNLCTTISRAGLECRYLHTQYSCQNYTACQLTN